MSKSVILAVGSFRKGSFNQTLADYIKSSFEKQGVTAEFLDYADVPMFNQDTEYPAPQSVVSVRSQVEKADALFLVTPEHNGALPAVLKNVLDWLSRPVVEFDQESPRVLYGKKATVAGAAGSTLAQFVRANAVSFLNYIRMDVMPGEGLGLQLPMEAWTTGVFVLSDEQKEAVDNYVKEFIQFLG